MLLKELIQITEADLQSLIDNAVAEGKSIDYKQELPGNSDSDKKEFLADVSSFANASGGDLVIGISENRGTGAPETLAGLTIANVDQEILRLDSIIREGVEPRIPSCTIRSIVLASGNKVLIVRVGKSWISPHRVIFKGHDKFYSRSSNGKYALDVGELRTAFTLSETIIDRVNKFRTERIARLIADETPIPFTKFPKTVLHILPLISFQPAGRYDLGGIAARPASLQPISGRSWDYKFNLEGFLTYAVAGRDGKSYSYTQMYKTGIVEAVEGSLLTPRTEGLLILGVAYENELINAIKGYINVLKSLRIEPPIIIFLSLLGVKGYKMYTPGPLFMLGDSPGVDRDVLLLPEVVIDNYSVDVAEIMKTCFDSLWNACGYPKSSGYDDNGNRVK